MENRIYKAKQKACFNTLTLNQPDFGIYTVRCYEGPLMKIYFITQNFTLLRETLLYYANLYYMKSFFYNNWIH